MAQDPGSGLSNTSQPSSNPDTVVIVLMIMNVIQSGIILVQAIMNNGSISRKSVDTFFTGLKGLAKITAWDGDDKIVDGGEKVTNALLGDRIKDDAPAPMPVPAPAPAPIPAPNL